MRTIFIVETTKQWHYKGKWGGRRNEQSKAERQKCSKQRRTEKEKSTSIFEITLAMKGAKNGQHYLSLVRLRDWSSKGCGHEYCHLTRCDAVQSGRNLTTFRRNVQPPSSGQIKMAAVPVNVYQTTRHHNTKNTFVSEKLPGDKEPHILGRTHTEFLQPHAKLNVTLPPEFSATQASNLTNHVLTSSSVKNLTSSAFHQLLQFTWSRYTEATEMSPMDRSSPRLTKQVGSRGSRLGRTHR